MCYLFYNKKHKKYILNKQGLKIYLAEFIIVTYNFITSLKIKGINIMISLELYFKNKKFYGT